MVITLIGYRGCGKSSVAPVLASLLGWECVDSDVVIEEQAGCSIREIFEAEGETGFRARESDTLQLLLSKTNLVVAAGGGAILAESNRSMMKQAGPVIWLSASNETLAKRIAGDLSTAERRPSLTGQAVTDEVAAVMKIRLPLYQAAATLAVETDQLSPADIADRIINELELAASQESDA